MRLEPVLLAIVDPTWGDKPPGSDIGSLGELINADKVFKEIAGNDEADVRCRQCGSSEVTPQPLQVGNYPIGECR